VLGLGLVSGFRAELAGLPGVSFDLQMTNRGRPNVEAMLSGARASVRAEMERRQVIAEGAIRDGDGARLASVLAGAPADAKRNAEAWLAASPAERAALLPELHHDFDAFGDDVISRTQGGVKRAFASAVTRV